MEGDLEKYLSEFQDIVSKKYPGRIISFKIIRNYVLGKTVNETARELDDDLDYVRNIYLLLNKIKKED